MSAVSEQTEILVPGPAQALGALLDVPVPDLENEGLPLLWHWIYFLDRPAQADLGLDGHPVRGTVPAPPGPGLRRMWAGGRVRVSGTLRCGEPATRRSRPDPPRTRRPGGAGSTARRCFAARAIGRTRGPAVFHLTAGLLATHLLRERDLLQLAHPLRCQRGDPAVGRIDHDRRPPRFHDLGA